MRDSRLRISPLVVSSAVIGLLGLDPARPEIPPTIYDRDRSDERPIWVSSRTFDDQDVLDLDLLAPEVAEKLEAAITESVESPLQCDVWSSKHTERPEWADAGDVFSSLISAHVGRIVAVDTGFYHSIPATLIEMAAEEDFVPRLDRLIRLDAHARSRLFVYPAARLEIGGVSVCDFTAHDLPTDLVGSAVAALVEQPPASGIASVNDRLLIIRSRDDRIFAPSVLQDFDLTRDLSDIVVKLHRAWKAKGGEWVAKATANRDTIGTHEG